MAGALLWPLSAATAAISYAVYKRAQKASASVPERYIVNTPIFPEEFDDVTRSTDIYLLFVSLENMELLGNFKRSVIHIQLSKSQNRCLSLGSARLSVYLLCSSLFRISAFFLSHSCIIVWPCDGNSNLLLIFQSITALHLRNLVSGSRSLEFQVTWGGGR